MLTPNDTGQSSQHHSALPYQKQIGWKNIIEWAYKHKVIKKKIDVSKAYTNDFIPKIIIDCVLDFEDISDKLIDELEFLKPFGMGNNEPLFMARNIDVVSSRMVGNNHRRMVLRQGEERTEKMFNSIHFNVEPGTPLKEHFD